MFNINIDNKWHQVAELKDWETRHIYYLKIFIYRFLVFLHWTLKTEEDIISIDSTPANKKDILYLQYIKTFKDIFTDTGILKELNYESASNTNHFFKNNLIKYIKWIVKDGKIMDYDEFITNSKGKYEAMSNVIEYFTEIENDVSDKSLNVLKCFHLMSTSFLNKFGHYYQITEKEKLEKLLNKYKSEITIKEGFKLFIEKNKFKEIIEKLKKNSL